MRIGVLCGGFSSERSISLASGEAVTRALIRAGSDAVMLDITSQDGAREQIQQSGIDLAFIALHGLFGEDGQVQSLLEDLNIPYTGSGVQSSRKAIDKVQSKTLFREKELPTPDWMLVKTGEKDVAPPPYPVVVKPRAQGSSVGTSLVHNEKEWIEAQAKASPFDNTLLVETYVSGDEITVGILNDRPLPVVRLLPKRPFYDFKAKYEEGWVTYEAPARIDAQTAHRAQQAALAAHRAIGCFCFSRVDIILSSDGTPWILELNTIPGFTDKSLLPKAAVVNGISFDELVLKIVKATLDHREGRRKTGGRKHAFKT